MTSPVSPNRSLVGEAGADPVGEASDVRMVDEPSGFEWKTGRIWR